MNFDPIIFAMMKKGFGGAGADYAQNDPDGPGYILNRPCFFTGNMLQDIIASDAAVVIGFEPAPYSGGLMEAGETYRLTINGVSVDLVASSESFDDLTGVTIGDIYADFYAGMTGQGEFSPTYGYLFGVMKNSGSNLAALVPTDGTGSMLAAAFGLTEEQLAANQVTVTMAKLTPEAVKLDRRLLPDGIGNDFVVLDGNGIGLSTSKSAAVSVPTDVIDEIKQAYQDGTTILYREVVTSASINMLLLPCAQWGEAIIFNSVLGSSLFEFYVNIKENTITIKEMSLIGPTGPQGKEGEQGPPGEPGMDGLPGEPGYTPQRGMDYWTVEDIQSIHDYIDQQIGAIKNGDN